MNGRNIKATAIGIAGVACAILTSCAFSDDGSSWDGKGAGHNVAFKTYLTDAPNLDLTNVFVNIHHVELWVESDGRTARIITAEGLGRIDLLQLQNGALLPLNTLLLPNDTLIKKFRIVLEEDGHSAVRVDGSTCTMKTPSAQKSGLKINLAESILLKKNSGYTAVIDFDAKKSIIQQGNGKCLLKPVLKLKKAIRHDVDDSINYILGDEINNEVQILSGEDLLASNTADNSDDDASGGFDYTDPSTWPPNMTPEEFNATQRHLKSLDLNLNQDQQE